MAHRVEIETSAFKAITRLQRADAARVMERIRSLATDPRPAGAVKLSGTPGWRVRSGNYRIVYVVDDGAQTVTVTRVGHRRDVYRRLT